MARHGENIHKRKDGRWEGRYIKGRSETGKAIWGYVYAYSYVDAKSALIRKKVKAADYTVPLGAQELTFSVLSELWLSTLNDLEESSIAHYRYSIEHYILPVIGDLRISQLSGAKLELCVLQIISPVGGEHKRFGASLSRECISLVRRLCKYAYKLHQSGFCRPESCFPPSPFRTEKAQIPTSHFAAESYFFHRGRNPAD